MKLHWPAGLWLTLPSDRPLFAGTFAWKKSTATPVFASYRADIASLSPEMVLTRKQNDAGGNDTHAAGWTEFCGEQSRREIVSPRIFLGKKITGQVAPSRVSKYVYVSYICVSLGVACASAFAHSFSAQDGKIRRRESGT